MTVKLYKNIPEVVEKKPFAIQVTQWGNEVLISLVDPVTGLAPACPDILTIGPNGIFRCGSLLGADPGNKDRIPFAMDGHKIAIRN